MKKYTKPMVPDSFYHIYNRACGFDKIFLEEKNYIHFMDLFEERMLDFVDLYCYCLIPNHFHMLVKTKQFQAVEVNKPNYTKKFSNLFAAYAQSFNNYYNRKGSLFAQNFRRKLISNENYLISVMIYIHRNPIRHGLVTNLADWKYSSYLEYLHAVPRYCKNSELLTWFSTKEFYKQCHSLDTDSDIE